MSALYSKRDPGGKLVECERDGQLIKMISVLDGERDGGSTDMMLLLRGEMPDATPGLYPCRGGAVRTLPRRSCPCHRPRQE